MNDNQKQDIQYLSAIHSLIDFAESLPIELLLDKNIEPTYPVTIGERFVNYVLDIVLMTKWHNDIHEEATDEICSILSQLDINVASQAEWQKLFEANRVLAQHITTRA